MAYSLVVTQSAEADLAGIVAYLVEKLGNPPAALNLLDAVEACYDRLEQNPYVYAACAQPMLSGSGYRKAVLGSYLMIYHVDRPRGLVYIDRFFSELQDYADKL